MNYCSGCHSLKYERYSRIAEDLEISARAARKEPAAARRQVRRLHPDARMPAADAKNWFGKAPPDLSLMARSRGTDYIYQFLKTFYVDPAQPDRRRTTCGLPATAMPHVLSELQGVKKAVCKDVDASAARTARRRHREGVRSL